MATRELNENDLKDVVGGFGEKTGDVKNNQVYIKMPGIAAGYSGYYTCEKLEALADQFISFAGLITPNITKDIKDAVNKLYEINGKTMTNNVKTLMGI